LIITLLLLIQPQRRIGLDILRRSKKLTENIELFDAAYYLDSDESIAEYLAASIGNSSPDMLLIAI